MFNIRFKLCIILFNVLIFSAFPSTSDAKKSSSQLDNFSVVWKNEILLNLDNKTISQENLLKTSAAFDQLEKSNLTEYLADIAEKDSTNGVNHVEDSLNTIKTAIENLTAGKTVYNDREMLLKISQANLALFELERYECENSEKSTDALYATILALLGVLCGSSLILFAVYKRYKQKLDESNELGIYATYMIEGSEKERSRISKEIHDTVLQDLKVLDMKINDELLENSMKKLRSICTELTPPELKSQINKENGFISAVGNLVNQFNQAENIKCSLQLQENLDSKSLSVNKIANVFRIIQEALNNIKTHSKAQNCSIIVRNGDRNGKPTIIIFISDDGIGFDMNRKSSGYIGGDNHFGLENMQERAKILGGSLEILSEENCGTELRLEFAI